jgi:hypothetical protein
VITKESPPVPAQCCSLLFFDRFYAFLDVSRADRRCPGGVWKRTDLCKPRPHRRPLPAAVFDPGQGSLPGAGPGPHDPLPAPGSLLPGSALRPGLQGNRRLPSCSLLPPSSGEVTSSSPTVRGPWPSPYIRLNTSEALVHIAITPAGGGGTWTTYITPVCPAQA